MAHARLIKSIIEKIPFVEEGSATYFDTEMPGFGLRVGKKQKTFFVQRDVRGRARSSTIGPSHIWTADEARQEARERLLLLSKGIDPNEVKRREAIQGMTLRTLMEEFFTARKTMQPRTRLDYRGYLQRYLTDWLDKAVTEITEDKVMKRYAYIGENSGKTVANNTRRVLSSMLNYAIAAHKLMEKNPVRIIAETQSAYPENRRRNYIKPHQLKAWYEAVNVLPNRTYRDYLLLVLFTGLRRNEAATLRWKYVDFADRTLTIPQTKNGEQHTLPLSDFLYDLLQERKTLTKDSEYVFPSRNKKGKKPHFSEPKKGVEAVVDATGVDFIVHDLRRTFITIAESLEIGAYTLKALINHRTNDITGSYIVRDVERLRIPMQKISSFILEKINNGK